MTVGASDRVFEKCAWRLLPLIMAAYVFNYIDRVNVGFAALTMNRDLGFSPSVYGFGVGILFVGYSLFQVPANIVLHRVGARRWLAFILASWGAACVAGALIESPLSFYAVRFLLGVAEAGLVPGVVLYLTYWFPKAWLGRANALAISSVFVALIIGGPLASLILSLDGIAGIRGWQWLFLLEGLPPLLLAVAVILLLPDRPADARWLSEDEKKHIADGLERENAAKESNLLRSLRDPRVLLLGLAHGCYLFGFYGLSFWMPLVIQGVGFSDRATGWVAGLVYFAALPAMYLWARSSDRRGERIWHGAIALLILSAALAVAATQAGSWVGLLALSIAAMGAGAWLGPFASMPRLFLSGPALAGGIAMVFATSNLLGGFAGQYLFGVLRQSSGSYAVPFVAASAVTLIAAIVVLSLRRSVAQQVLRQAVPAE